MRAKRTVFLKELKETLRDRRTLMIMVVVPVLLYPVMLIFAEQVALFGMRRIGSEPARVAVQGAPGRELLDYLGGLDDLALIDLALVDVVLADVSAAEAALRSDSVHAVAIFGDEGTDSEMASRTVTVLYNAADDRSQRARSILAGALDAWGDTLLARRLFERGLPSGFADPLAVADSSVALPEEIGGYALGRFLPWLLIVITLLGTFYPAIDLAAGEKERGTLETLMTAPIPARDVVAGKFATVAVIGIVAAGLNLASMLLTFQTGLFQFGGSLEIEFSIPFGVILLIFATLVPLSVLFGALFLGVAVRSMSFKEAQNTLTPIYLLAFLPALLPIFPGIDLTPFLAVVPVAGVALLFRELMAGEAPVALGTLALLSTVLYAWAALVFAARAFGNEQVLFGADSGAARVSEEGAGALRRLRSALQPDGGRTPGVPQALGFIVGLAALFLYVGVTLQIRLGEVGVLLSEWGVLFAPAVLFTVVAGYDMRETLGLVRPRPRHVGAAVLIIAGGLPLGWFIAWAQSWVLPIPFEILEALSDFVTAEDPLRFAWLFFLIAITPALCEETVFRGILLNGTRSAMPPVRLILLNAGVFGAFHLSTQTVFRFLPTAWLGVLLATVAWRTRSIWPSVLMHALNNGAIVILASSPALQDILGGDDGAPPWMLLPLSLAVMAVGFHLLLRDPAGPEHAGFAGGSQ